MLSRLIFSLLSLVVRTLMVLHVFAVLSDFINFFQFDGYMMISQYDFKVKLLFDEKYKCTEHA